MKETVYKKRVLELTACDVMDALADYYDLSRRDLRVMVADCGEPDGYGLNPSDTDTWLTVTSEEGTL